MMYMYHKTHIHVKKKLGVGKDSGRLDKEAKIWFIFKV
jgi:hypothetical protein